MLHIYGSRLRSLLAHPEPDRAPNTARGGESRAASATDRLQPENPPAPTASAGSILLGASKQIAAIDFGAVPTLTFRNLYCFIILPHDRREVIHFNVTAHPTAEWTARQLIEAFPEDSAPRYLLRDRDQIYGEESRLRVQGMQIEEVITAPRSPFQNPYAERVIGSIRRECLDHLIIIGEDHARRCRPMRRRPEIESSIRRRDRRRVIRK